MKTKIFSTIALLVIVAAQAEAASPFKKISGNKLQHVFSNVTFPAKVALFSRAQTQLYDSAGRDVSVRYLLDELILADVYAYPAARSLKQEIARQQADIRRLSKNVRMISDTGIQTTQNGKTISGKRMTFDLVRTNGLFGRPLQRCTSQFIIFQEGAWFIAYRYSYPRERSEIAAKHVDDFVAQWRWHEK